MDVAHVLSGLREAVKSQREWWTFSEFEYNESIFKVCVCVCALVPVCFRKWLIICICPCTVTQHPTQPCEGPECNTHYSLYLSLGLPCLFFPMSLHNSLLVPFCFALPCFLIIFLIFFLSFLWPTFCVMFFSFIPLKFHTCFLDVFYVSCCLCLCIHQEGFVSLSSLAERNHFVTSSWAPGRVRWPQPRMWLQHCAVVLNVRLLSTRSLQLAGGVRF